MEEQKNNKCELSTELDNEVKKVSITGKDGEEQVVMKQEIGEEDLDEAAGGEKNFCSGYCVVVKHKIAFSCNPYSLK